MTTMLLVAPKLIGHRPKAAVVLPKLACIETHEEYIRSRRMEKLIGYLIAGLGPFGIAAAAIAYIESHRPGGQWNSNTTTVLFGAAAACSTSLIGAMTSYFNGKLAAQVNKKVDVAATHSTAADEKIEKVQEVIKKVEIKVNDALTESRRDRNGSAPNSIH